MDFNESQMDVVILNGVKSRLAAQSALAAWLGLEPIAQTEDDRIAIVKARGIVPAACGPEIPLAPARGGVVAVEINRLVMDGDDWIATPSGHLGRYAARARDVFDLMSDQSRRAGGSAPFTRQQMDAGRLYAALCERHASAGARGSLSGLSAGVGGGSGFSDGIMDRIIDDGRTIAGMRAAIGNDWALEVVRKTKRRRDPLSVRELVDRVCLRQESIDSILRSAGWGVYGETILWARRSLAAALDRMWSQAENKRH